MFTLLPAAYGHCGLCGYTGRVKGLRQRVCLEKNGWHKWLEKCADEETWSLWFNSWERKRALISMRLNLSSYTARSFHEES